MDRNESRTRRDATTEDLDMVPSIVAVARAAGERLLGIFSRDARPLALTDILAAVEHNEAHALEGMRDALQRLRPQARWLDESQESAVLPDGEWWVVDAVEGNVNLIHGMSEWCVTITLVRDNVPVVAVVYQPVGDVTYTAVRGAGAHRNGTPLHVSPKTALDAAIVTTGQAEAGQTSTHGRIGRSITVMLGHALLVRATVPSTFPMLLVAQGQNDVFWQYQPVLPGMAAGVLLVTEAGGVASRIDGSPWRPGSPDVLLSTPALHATTVELLATV
jgi:myo-inositol-1(or 4)-monophosphatase